jgi:hypothetical protein
MTSMTMARKAKKPCLQPPFSREVALRGSDVVLPHVDDGPFEADKLLDQSDNIRLYLQWDLQTSTAEKTRQHLWLSGVSRPARALHQLSLLLRAIHATEDPNEHLLWHDQRIFIKPLPEYLLNYDFWVQHIIHDEELCRSARGILLSYAWMVGHKTDMRIASEAGLMPRSLDYDQWLKLRSEALANIDRASLLQQRVSARFFVRTLNLPPLSLRLSLRPLSAPIQLVSATFTTQNIAHTFTYISQPAREFFAHDFGWLLTMLAFINTMVSPGQGGWGKEKLRLASRLQNPFYAVVFAMTAAIALATFSEVLNWWAMFRLTPASPTKRSVVEVQAWRQGQLASVRFPFESPASVCAQYSD